MGCHLTAAVVFMVIVRDEQTESVELGFGLRLQKSLIHCKLEPPVVRSMIQTR